MADRENAAADALWTTEMSLSDGAAAGCVFCRILQGELPCAKVHENDEAWVFTDLRPAAPVHLLVVPRRHVARLGACGDPHGAWLGRLLLTANEAAAANGVKDFRLIVNNGPGAGQTVPHLHLHILAGDTLGERLL